MLKMYPENAEFARLLRDAGWTQSEAAEQLCLNRVSINKIVNGKIRVSMTSLRLLSELTGGAIHLPGFTLGSKQLAEGKTQYVATGWENDLIREFRQLTAGQRNALIETARQFVVAQTRSTEDPSGFKSEKNRNFPDNTLIDNEGTRTDSPRNVSLNDSIRPTAPKMKPPPFAQFSQKQKDRWEGNTNLKNSPKNP